nr:PREDICTED: uncharacterized protein LOC102352328 [Latimeria chalumnae]|eukprot:XP_014347367.1 PREDICTED: uncharacterized protein LOC102352328 [Latimeria chalumnae]
MMNLVNGKVLDIQLVQSNEVKNFCAMELEGLKRSFAFLSEKGIDVADFTSDRHPQIRKYTRENKPGVTHWFDVWHVAKGLTKKISKAGNKSGFQILKWWSHSISNHMYWCTSTSGGVQELVAHKWLSIINHVANIHTGHGTRFPACEHGDIGEQSWIEEGSRQHKYLEDIICNKRRVNDVKQLSPQSSDVFVGEFSLRNMSLCTEVCSFLS